MSEVTTKEKFKAIVMLGGLNTPKKFAKVMDMQEEYARQLLSKKSKVPNYMRLVVYLFEKYLDK